MSKPELAPETKKLPLEETTNLESLIKKVNRIKF